MRRNVAVFSGPDRAVQLGEFPGYQMGDETHRMNDQELIDHARDWLVVAGHFSAEELEHHHLAVTEGG